MQASFKSLRDNQIQVTEAIVLLDREQGGFDNVQTHGVKLHRFLVI